MVGQSVFYWGTPKHKNTFQATQGNTKILGIIFITLNYNLMCWLGLIWLHV